jgi:hypothetical protein
VHELSIAVALVEMACEKAADLGDVRVDALHLRLGPLLVLCHPTRGGVAATLLEIAGRCGPIRSATTRCAWAR